MTLDKNDPELQQILTAPDLDTEGRYRAIKELREKRKHEADDGKITPAQQVFIDAMINGARQAEAYRIAYPNATEASVYSSASRLMDRPSIVRQIDDGILGLHLYKQRKIREGVLQKLQGIKDNREVLHDIIHNNRIAKTTTVNKDTGATIIKFREDPMLAIQAIKLDMKLEDIQDTLEDQLSHLGDYTEPGDEEADLENPQKSCQTLAIPTGRNQKIAANVSNEKRNKKTKSPLRFTSNEIVNENRGEIEGQNTRTCKNKAPQNLVKP